MSKNKLRSVNTRFWEDPFIENLNPSEKLLFLYFLTNPLANILGIYEISIKRICYDTGLNKSTVEETLKGFKSLGKVFYVDSYIILSNFLKNQNLNPNMFTGAVELFNNLPISVKNSVLNNDLKAFERVLKASQDFEKYESEIEIEVEIETENKKDIYSDFLLKFNKITNRKFRLLDDKTKRQLSARLKEGFKIEEIYTAIENCKKDKYHIENPQYLTPEFITRSDKLQKYLNFTEQGQFMQPPKVLQNGLTYDSDFD